MLRFKFKVESGKKLAKSEIYVFTLISFYIMYICQLN